MQLVSWFTKNKREALWSVCQEEKERKRKRFNRPEVWSLAFVVPLLHLNQNVKRKIVLHTKSRNYVRKAECQISLFHKHLRTLVHIKIQQSEKKFFKKTMDGA